MNWLRTSREQEFEYLRESAVGSLLKKFWQGLSYKEKREFIFPLYEVAGHYPGIWNQDELRKSMNGFDLLPTVAGELRQFFIEVLDLGRWEWKLSRKKPKYRRYLKYLDECKRKKLLEGFQNKMDAVIKDVREGTGRARGSSDPQSKANEGRKCA